MYVSLTQIASILWIILFNFNSPGVEIKKITPYKDSDELKCDVFTNDIFDAGTRSTLMSGLTVHLIISMKLVDINKKQLLKNKSEIIVQYDVWDEVFFVHYDEKREQFRSLDSLERNSTILKRIRIIPLSQLPSEQEFYISMKIHVQIDHAGSLIDSIDNNSFSKKFGIGSIIKFFFGSSEPEDNWYHSEKFKLSELKSY